VLPLTIISITVVIKWWDVQIDGYREFLPGFPFVCPGWHTKGDDSFSLGDPDRKDLCDRIRNLIGL
jgi:hypothetical protein